MYPQQGAALRHVPADPRRQEVRAPAAFQRLAREHLPGLAKGQLLVTLRFR